MVWPGFNRNSLLLSNFLRNYHFNFTFINFNFFAIKKEFGFYTLEERVRVSPALGRHAKEWLALTGEFRYEAHARQYEYKD